MAYPVVAMTSGTATTDLFDAMHRAAVDAEDYEGVLVTVIVLEVTEPVRATEISFRTLKNFATDANLVRDTFGDKRVEAVIFNADETRLALDVLIEGKRYRVEVRCVVSNAQVAAKHHVFDVEKELAGYFNRVGRAVPVTSGGVAELEREARSIAHAFVEDPPELPGIEVDLLEVKPLARSIPPRVPRRTDAEHERRPPRAVITPPDPLKDAGMKELQKLIDMLGLRGSGDGTLPYASIWVSGDDGSEVRDALREFAEEHGLRLVEDGPPVQGSWKQRFKLIGKAIAGNEVVKEAAEDLLVRARLEAVAKTKAQVDAINADTVSKLIASIDAQEEGVVVFGPAIIVKYSGAIFVRSVDPVVASKLERMPVLMTDAKAMLDMLAGTMEQETHGQYQRPALRVQHGRELESGD